MTSERDALSNFLVESLAIEGIFRQPTHAEITGSLNFIKLPVMTLDDIYAIQSIYAPGKPVRSKISMDVQVGMSLPPPGGPTIPGKLAKIIGRANDNEEPWRIHVDFEALHPFMDGNGRTGRILWVWGMERMWHNPFAISFLHRFYYQTLGALHNTLDRVSE